MNERSLNILKELTNAPGASGFEDAVVAAARKYVEGIGKVKEDFLRNLYIYRKENTGTKPVVMLSTSSPTALSAFSLSEVGTKTPSPPVRFWCAMLSANIFPAL